MPENKIKILVLGATGMLGQMVMKYLARDWGFSVFGTQPQRNGKWLYLDALKGGKHLKRIFNNRGFDYCINCIGITKNKIDEADVVSAAKTIKINALFPHELSFLAAKNGIKVIQISSDGVFSGKNKFYDESFPCDCQDVYGRSKVLGEVDAPDFLNIRCSIVGPSPFEKGGLYQWFISQPNGAKVPGYTNHIWNGVTTLQFAQLCRLIIRKDIFKRMRKESKVFHFAPNQPVTKYELIVLLKKVLDKDITVVRATSGSKAVKRILISKYAIMKKLYPRVVPMVSALKEMVRGF
ncbi:MAG: sugar nucleotide-binding protein [Candidatus Omnitrophica bacterium]|nr:sugar nucleotide-binding protein [Candidatus Omnitrophota bacterium]